MGALAWTAARELRSERRQLELHLPLAWRKDAIDKEPEASTLEDMFEAGNWGNLDELAY
eukprot:CAMPEP_0177790318 /NCGR_PEP_ID=MMETSP0491_2-20121128/23278_1 /TAXON_ID=63592 /ORGANISM="Tetraselmis chuii, Strain PLY429" /LENGTH=58 /DNA_ID=CAMNT_0019312359 /DNA_START=560 /DNA_END=736 /DNA_ORIENTATION=+